MKCLLGKERHDLTKMLCCKHGFWIISLWMAHYPLLFSPPFLRPSVVIADNYQGLCTFITIIIKTIVIMCLAEVNSIHFRYISKYIYIHFFPFHSWRFGDWRWSYFRNKKLVLHRFPFELFCVSIDGKFCSINSTGRKLRWSATRQNSSPSSCVDLTGMDSFGCIFWYFPLISYWCQRHFSAAE